MTFQGPGGSTSLTAGALHARARARASALAWVLPPEGVALIALPAAREVIVTFFAVQARGGVAVILPVARPGSEPLSWWRRAAVLAQEAGASCLLTGSPAPAGLPPFPCPVLVLDDECDGSDAARPVDDVDQSGPSYIQYSSGTTGRPKGAVISHRAVLGAVDALASRWEWSDKDVSVGWLPLFHDMGLVTQVLLPVLTGASSVIMDAAHWVRSPAKLLQAVGAAHGTMTWMPNFAFAHCTKHVRDEHLAGVDLASWRLVGNGGELAEPEVLDAFAARFAPWGLDPSALMVGYGMAENVVGVSTCGPGQGVRRDWVDVARMLQEGVAAPASPADANARAIAACGWAFPGTTVVVRDDSGRPVPERVIGEVTLTGDYLFSGYHRRGDATAAAFRDGHYRTGDLAYVADGALHVLERMDDMLVVGGRNIRPHDVESVVRDALDRETPVVAFGVRDADVGTDVLVVVCERSDPALHLVDAAAVRQAVTAQLGVVARVRVVEKGWIPRTTSGKISRGSSRDRHLAEPS